MLRGHAHYRNETFPLVREYLKRSCLAKLGYTAPIEGLSADKAEAFYMIELEIEAFKKSLTERASGGRPPRKG